VLKVVVLQNAIKEFDIGVFLMARARTEDFARSAETCEDLFGCADVGYVPR
jgi:hypothetical protein